MEPSDLTFTDGQVICRQNEPVEDVFVLNAGKVVIKVNTDIHDVVSDEEIQNAQSVSTIDRVGAIIGEAGVWIGHRTATLIAQGDVSLKRLPMPPKEAEAFAARRPEVGLDIANTMAKRIAETEARSKGDLETLAMLEDARDAAAMDIAKIVDALEAFATDKNDDAIHNAIAQARAHPMYAHAVELRDSITDASRLVKDVIVDALKEQGMYEIDDGRTLRKGSEEPRAAFVVVEGELDVVRGERRVAGIRTGSVADIVSCLTGKQAGNRTELRARGKTRVLRLPKEVIQDSCKRNPKLLIAVLRTLASELGGANQVLTGATKALATVKETLVGPESSIVELSELILPSMRPYPEELRLELDRVTQNRDEVRHLLEMFGL